MTDRASVSERDLREFIEAAEELHREVGHKAVDSTEQAFSLALDALKFDLNKGESR